MKLFFCLLLMTNLLPTLGQKITKRDYNIILNDSTLNNLDTMGNMIGKWLFFNDGFHSELYTSHTIGNYNNNTKHGYWITYRKNKIFEIRNYKMGNLQEIIKYKYNKITMVFKRITNSNLVRILSYHYLGNPRMIAIWDIKTYTFNFFLKERKKIKFEASFNQDILYDFISC